MSVINQMLVDLERRRASGEERKRIPDHVRALPDETGGVPARMPVVAAVLTGAAVLAAGAWWWLATRPAVVPAAPAIPPVAARVATQPEAGHDAVALVAGRMSFDLEHVPEAGGADPDGAQRGIDAATVIARPRPAPAPVAAPVQSRAAGVASGKVLRDAAAKPAPAAPAAAHPEIDKRVREQTPRQRAETEYAKGAAALQQGRDGDARAAFEAALQIDPLYHGARQALVGVLLNARQPAEVSRVLQEGLQLAPAQYGFAMALARLQVEQGNLDAGVQTLARSLDYADASPEYIAFYAGLLQRQQKHAEAVEQFLRALRLRGNAGVWLLGLGVSLDALGRGGEAQDAYRRAKASGSLSAELQAFVDQRLR